MITLVLGGTRSGKSEVAERLAAAAAGDGPVTYVATGRAVDDDMAARIAAHRARRPAGVGHAGGRAPTCRTALRDLAGPVLVDSLGTWVAAHDDLAPTSPALRAALGGAGPGDTVVVSEEVGLGVHPPTEVGRRFADALGALNRAVAEVADRVLLVVAGRVLPLDRAAPEAPDARRRSAFLTVVGGAAPPSDAGRPPWFGVVGALVGLAVGGRLVGRRRAVAAAGGGGAGRGRRRRADRDAAPRRPGRQRRRPAAPAAPGRGAWRSWPPPTSAPSAWSALVVVLGGPGGGASPRWRPTSLLVAGLWAGARAAMAVTLALSPTPGPAARRRASPGRRRPRVAVRDAGRSRRWPWWPRPAAWPGPSPRWPPRRRLRGRGGARRPAARRLHGRRAGRGRASWPRRWACWWRRPGGEPRAWAPAGPLRGRRPGWCVDRVVGEPPVPDALAPGGRCSGPGVAALEGRIYDDRRAPGVVLAAAGRRGGGAGGRRAAVAGRGRLPGHVRAGPARRRHRGGRRPGGGRPRPGPGPAARARRAGTRPALDAAAHRPGGRRVGGREHHRRRRGARPVDAGRRGAWARSSTGPATRSTRWSATATPRYRRFGTAAARLDDVLAWVPARATAVLVAAGPAPARAADGVAHGPAPTPAAPPLPQRRRGRGRVRRRPRPAARRRARTATATWSSAGRRSARRPRAGGRRHRRRRRPVPGRHLGCWPALLAAAGAAAAWAPPSPDRRRVSPATAPIPPPGPHGGDGARVAAALGLDPTTSSTCRPASTPFAPDVAALAAPPPRRPAAATPTSTRPRPTLAAGLGLAADRLVLTAGGAPGHRPGRRPPRAPAGSTSPTSRLYRRHLPRLDPAAPRWRSDPHNPSGLLAGARRGGRRVGRGVPAAGRRHLDPGPARAGRSGSLTKAFACPGLRLGYAARPRRRRRRRRCAGARPAWAVGGAGLRAACPTCWPRADPPALDRGAGRGPGRAGRRCSRPTAGTRCRPTPRGCWCPGPRACGTRWPATGSWCGTAPRSACPTTSASRSPTPTGSSLDAPSTGARLGDAGHESGGGRRWAMTPRGPVTCPPPSPARRPGRRSTPPSLVNAGRCRGARRHPLAPPGRPPPGGRPGPRRRRRGPASAARATARDATWRPARHLAAAGFPAAASPVGDAQHCRASRGPHARRHPPPGCRPACRGRPPVAGAGVRRPAGAPGRVRLAGRPQAGPFAAAALLVRPARRAGRGRRRGPTSSG